MIPILSILLLLPALGAVACILLPKHTRAIALGSALLALWVAGTAWVSYDAAAGGFQMEQRIQLTSTPGFDVAYHVGVDWLALPLVALTILLLVVSVLVSQREVHARQGAHHATLLALGSAVSLVFLARDLLLLFLAWELVLALMFMLILRWGLENRRYAAMKFLIYTGAGSGALLIAILLLGIGTGTFSLDGALAGIGSLSATTRVWILFLVLLAALIKMPIVPFHTWLPDAHVQAPTAGSILLAGVLLKMGAYALIRVGGPLVASAPSWWAQLLFWLGTVTVLYGAWVCIAQRHLKRLIAYASIGHMGLVLVGIAAGSVAPAVFLMVSHGLLSPLLFALAGLVHERTGTFDIGALGGLARTMPTTAWALVVAALGSMGLPGMSGFIAEITTLAAATASFGMVGLVPVLGLVLTGGYTALLITRTTVNAGRGAGGDETGVHPLPFLILFISTVLLGVLPSLLFGLVKP